MKKQLLTKILVLLCLCVVGGVKMLADTSTNVKEFASSELVTKSDYLSTYGGDDWSISMGGNNKSLGFNRNYCTTIGNNLGTSATATNYGVVVKSKKLLANVNRITFYYDGGSGDGSGKLYFAYSTDGTTWKALTLLSEEGLSTQGIMPQRSKDYTFEFDKISSAYYGFILDSEGTKKAAFRYDNVRVTFYNVESNKSLSSIDLSGNYPTTFHQGDEFSSNGITVTATYDDNTTKDVTASASYSGYDMNTIGSQTVTVSYTEKEVTKTATYGITVSTPATLSSITLSGEYTTTFEQNSAFSHEGMEVIAHYDDETNKNVTANAVVSTPDMATIGEKEVTVSYTENGITQTATYNINITELVDYQVLPFSWKGGEYNALSALTGIELNADQADYADSHSPYVVKFNGTGKYVIIKTNERPGKVKIGVKMIGGDSSSTITVQGSTDGVTFTDIEELTISGNTNSIVNLETTKEFGTDDRYVKLYYTKGSNIGVGPITIEKYIQKYTFSFSASPADGGSITVRDGDEKTVTSGSTFTENSALTIEATAYTGYSFIYWTADGIELTKEQEGNNQIGLTMPTNDVTLTADFTKNSHELNITSDHGAITVNGKTWTNGTTVEYGTEVSITATAKENWAFSSWEASGITLEDNSDRTIVFLMPDKSVSLTAHYTDATVEYDIELQNVTGGTINASASKAVAGTEIILTQQANDGYRFDGWYVLNDKSEEVPVTNDKFTMPGMKVYVDATFIPVYTASFYVNGTFNSSAIYTNGDAIDFPTVNDQNGMKFMGWTTSEITGTQSSAPDVLVSSASMGNAAQNYYAVFALSTGAIETATLTASFTKPETTYESRSYTDDKGNTWSGVTSNAYDNNIARITLNSGDKYLNSPELPGNITEIKAMTYNGSGSARVFYINSEKGKTGDLGSISGPANTKATQEQTATLNGTFNKFILQSSGSLGFAYIKVTYSTLAQTDYCTTIPTSVPVTIGAAKFSSVYYSSNALEVPTGMKAYTFKVDESNKLKVSKTYNAGDVVPAGEGVVLNAEQGNYELSITTSDDEKDADNVLRGYDVAHLTEGGSVYYRLTTKGGDLSTVGFYWGAENGGAFTVAAHKVYVAVDEQLNFGENGVRLATLISEEETTGISESLVRKEDMTTLIYNLNGQKVQKPSKGLYIVNGKKTVIK